MPPVDMMIECISSIRPTDPGSPDSRPLNEAHVPAILQSPYETPKTLVSVQRHGIFVSVGTDGLWVVLEWYPSSETSRMTVDKERIEEFPVLSPFFT